MSEQATTPAPTETAALVSAQELTAPLAERMPPVTPGQGDSQAPAPEVKPAAPVPEGPAVYDSRRIKFSPARHQANADGTPVKNRKGNFVLKADYRQAHGQRPLVGKTAGPTPAPAERPPATFGGESPSPGLVPPAGPDEYELMAEVYLQSSYGPMMLAFTPEVRPDHEEHAALKQSLAALLRKKQSKELDPAWAFGLTATAVFVRKTQNPTVKERLVLYWIKVRAAFGKKTPTV